ncbi:MAG: carboxypeptidase regulatory-like domain-containing protein [Nannocystaceae bacterium]
MNRAPSPPRRPLALALAAGGLLTALAVGGAQAEAPAADADEAAATGELRGTVRLLKRGKRALKDSSNVVVYLEEVPGEPPTPPEQPHEVYQRDKTFVPEVSAVVKGTTIAFPNDDKIFHNVFSMSRALKFDLGLYKSGTTKSVVATREGIVDIYCNIHPDMAAKVLVLDSAHFAVTGEDGRFAIQGVPAGTYPIVAWQARGEPYRGEVTIRAGEVTELDLDLVAARGGGHEEHTRKDGTPYGRYK